MKPRFIIGIGSQRAGSTLLHRLFEQATDIFMHPIKELHYFDTLYGIRSPNALIDFSLRQIMREIDSLITAKTSKVLSKREKCYLRANRILATTPIDKVEYLDLFRPCLMGRTLVGEVTPEYMLLEESAIDGMRGVIGDNAGVVLLCRNPVKRLLSAVKLMNVYNGMNLTQVQADEWVRRMIEENTSWMQAQDKYNDYEKAIVRFSAKFPHFAAVSYDEMIEDPMAVAKKLETSLDIKIDHGDFAAGTKKVANDLGDNLEISTEIVEILKERTSRQTDFLNEHFSREVVK